MCTQKLGLIALTLFSAIAAPRSTYAQTYSGIWNGVANYSVSVNNQPVLSGSSDGSLWFIYDVPNQTTEIALVWNTGYADVIGVGPIAGQFAGGLIDGSVFPSLQGEYSGAGGDYPELLGIGNIFATYQSIDPSGKIDTSGANAVADITLFADYGGFRGEDVSIFVSFVSVVPEPSSSVSAVSAILIIGTMVCVRRFRPRQKSGACNPGQVKSWA